MFKNKLLPPVTLGIMGLDVTVKYKYQHNIYFSSGDKAQGYFIGDYSGISVGIPKHEYDALNVSEILVNDDGSHNV